MSRTQRKAALLIPQHARSPPGSDSPMSADGRSNALHPQMQQDCARLSSDAQLCVVARMPSNRFAWSKRGSNTSPLVSCTSGKQWTASFSADAVLQLQAQLPKMPLFPHIHLHLLHRSQQDLPCHCKSEPPAHSLPTNSLSTKLFYVLEECFNKWQIRRQEAIRCQF